MVSDQWPVHDEITTTPLSMPAIQWNWRRLRRLTTMASP